MLQWFNLIYKCMWIFHVKNRIHCKELCNFKLIELQWYWLSIYLYAWIDFAIVLIRFTNFEDQAWFNKTMSRVINEELSETHGAMVDSTHYFVDFMKWVTFPMQPLFGLHDLRVTSPWLSFCSFFIFFFPSCTSRCIHFLGTMVWESKIFGGRSDCITSPFFCFY